MNQNWAPPIQQRMACVSDDWCGPQYAAAPVPTVTCDYCGRAANRYVDASCEGCGAPPRHRRPRTAHWYGEAR